MQIVLLHISDIHVKSGRDFVLSRAGDIKDAIHSSAPNAAAVVVIVSGDIAFSGGEAQYGSARLFFEDLRSRLTSLPSIQGVDFIAIPGNHDCDLTHESDVRSFLLRDIQTLYQSTLELQGDSVRALLEVQKSFFTFEAQLRGGKELDFRDRLGYGYVLKYGNYSIKFQCFNTAWLSRNPEVPSKLFLPLDALKPLAGDANLCVSLFHHPYNWLDPSNFRLVRDLVEQTSDLVYTGHEHIGGGGNVERFSGEFLQYVEAEALQGENGELDSGFNLMLMDFVTGEQRLERFSWNGAAYISKHQKKWDKIIKNPARERDLFRVNSVFLDSLNDPGSLFRHKRRLNSLRLTDVYVYPDLKPTAIDAFSKAKVSQRVYSKDVTNHIRSGTRFLISGSDNVGKSAFLKSLYMDFSREFVPVLIDGQAFNGKVSEGRFQNIINQAVEEQYDKFSVARYSRLDPSRRLLLVDDFHKANLSQAGEAKFTMFAENQFGHAVVTISDIYRVRDLSRRRGDVDAFKLFAKLEMAEFGHGLRAKLIYKWLALGRETASELQALNYEAPATEKIITTLLGKNIVPAIPFNILTLLHTIEATQSHVTANASYGALYEFLISNSLSLSGSAKGADIHFNYASLVAYKMFEEARTALTETELRAIKKEYYEIFHIDPDLSRMLSELEAVRILEVTPSGSYAFRYKHLYYYFVAKYFQRVFKRSDQRAAKLRETLYYLADRLHNEEAANIILFYLHFAQDYDLIQHLLKGSRRIYQTLDLCDFESHAEFVNKLYVESPKKLLVIDDNVEAHREEYYQKADESEETDNMSIALDAKVTYSEQLSDIHKINIAFKTLQVLGQILRSSAQVMEGDLKLEIATESYFLGLRALRALLSLVENNVDDLRLYFSALIKERATALDLEQAITEEKIMKWTDEGVIWMTQTSAFAVIKKISYAVGHHSLSETYERIRETHGKNIGIAMSDVCVKLDHLSTVPEFEINVIRDRVLRNRFSSSVLRTIVMDHLYLRRIDIRMQQKLGAMFDIESVGKPKLLLE